MVGFISNYRKKKKISRNMWLGSGTGSMTWGQVLAQNGEVTCDGWFQTGCNPRSCVFPLRRCPTFLILWKEWRPILLVEVLYKLMRMAESILACLNRILTGAVMSHIFKHHQLIRTCNGCECEWMFGGARRSRWRELAATPLSACPRAAVDTT